MINAAQLKGDIMKYYLNGEQVGYNQAHAFFIEKALAKGLTYDDARAEWIWRGTEEGRETILDLTDCQIEIVEQ